MGVPQGRRALIVGSGFGGLSTAIRLLSDGWQVTILEARGEIGGRASRIREGGYTFDTGPSLITMPWLFEEVFAAAGEKMSDHVTLRQLQPGYRIFWTGEGRHFDFGSDQEALREEMRKFSAADAAQLDAFIAASGDIHRKGILISGRQNFLKLVDFVKLLPTMAQLDAIRFLEGWVAKFFKEPHVQQAFDSIRSSLAAILRASLQSIRHSPTCRSLTASGTPRVASTASLRRSERSSRRRAAVLPLTAKSIRSCIVVDAPLVCGPLMERSTMRIL
jgi:phytoene dehydrogenase-like protein